jgi:prepilin-type N-terminal cleavage/methylation domain-containing protein
MGKTNRAHKGFTLIELLIVITIIATLLVVVFAAINPAQRLKQARDARRTSDVDSILTAIHEYIIDNSGGSPTGLSTVQQQLGTATTGCAIATGGCTVTATACLSLATPLTAYLSSIPLDPNGGTAGTTKYSATQDSNGIVTIRACGTEGTTNIYSSR